MILAITNATESKTVLSFLTKTQKSDETLTVQVLGTERLTYTDCQQIQLVIKGQFPDAKVEIHAPTDSKALMLLCAVKIQNRSIDIGSDISLDVNLINKQNDLNLLINTICRKGVSKLTADELKTLITSGAPLKIEDLKKLGLCKIIFGAKFNRKQFSGKKKGNVSKQTSTMNQTIDKKPEDGKKSDSLAQVPDEGKKSDSLTQEEKLGRTVMDPQTKNSDKPPVKSDKQKKSMKNAVVKKENTKQD